MSSETKDVFRPFVIMERESKDCKRRKEKRSYTRQRPDRFEEGPNHTLVFTQCRRPKRTRDVPGLNVVFVELVKSFTSFVYVRNTPEP